MTNVATISRGAVALSEPDTIAVLQSSLYPGASAESVRMVLGYCQAAGLDPMQKPVHIVPMWDAKAGRMRDVVMPGVNLYRTQAARSGQFAGMSEPEFGPTITENIGGASITFPEWCRVTVKRLMSNGMIAEFTSREFWIENYAQKGGKEKSIAPNAMWTKRPRGQIAKCAGAQALRTAFPEIASQPTADEMEGKALQADDGDLPAACPPALLVVAQEAAGKGRAAFAAWWRAATPDDRGALRPHIDDLQKLVTKAETPLVEEVTEPAAEPTVEQQEHIDASS